MPEVELRIKAHLDQDSQWQRNSRRPPNGGALVVALLALVAVFAGRSGPFSPASSQFDAGASRLDGRQHVAVLSDKEIKGQRVLVLVDNSGSMRGKDTAPQLTRLVAAGISIATRETIPGYAISFTNGLSLLANFNSTIAASPNVDVVYIISDFAGEDDKANDPVAIEQFQRTLRSRQARIYWATVDQDPNAKYYEIARQTGGDVIPKEPR